MTNIWPIVTAVCFFIGGYEARICHEAWKQCRREKKLLRNAPPWSITQIDPKEMP
jgi:hypothetical protein